MAGLTTHVLDTSKGKPAVNLKIDLYKVINEQKKISNDKLIFLKAVSNVVKSGMDIVGVSVPEKM